MSTIVSNPNDSSEESLRKLVTLGINGTATANGVLDTRRTVFVNSPGFPQLTGIYVARTPTNTTTRPEYYYINDTGSNRDARIVYNTPVLPPSIAPDENRWTIYSDDGTGIYRSTTTGSMSPVGLSWEKSDDTNVSYAPFPQVTAFSDISVSYIASLPAISGTVTANVFGYDFPKDSFTQIRVQEAQEIIQGTTPVLAVGIANQGGGINSSNPLPISGTVTANNENIGVKADSSATTDTGTFSLISLVKRLLSKLPSLVASSVPTTDRGSVGTLANGTCITFTNTIGNLGWATSANQTVFASNANRKLVTIYNEGPGTLYLMYGAGTAGTTNYTVRLYTDEYLEIEKYTGQINGVFSIAGTARANEIT